MNGHTQTLDELVKSYVSVIMRKVQGDKPKAAEILKVSVRTLYRYDQCWGKDYWK